MKRALDDYGDIQRIIEVITDHRTQFSANNTDKNGEQECAFDAFLAKNEIKQILARVKHPQTNRKTKKNGIIPTRKAEYYSMILANS